MGVAVLAEADPPLPPQAESDITALNSTPKATDECDRRRFCSTAEACFLTGLSPCKVFFASCSGGVVARRTSNGLS
jgi:hypothetical protein